jgi:hypothetical protein
MTRSEDSLQPWVGGLAWYDSWTLIHFVVVCDFGARSTNSQSSFIRGFRPIGILYLLDEVLIIL